MRARRRRSVLNTISAAALEVAIMGIFVIIAQPQLRDALFEILQVDPDHGSTQMVAHTQRQDRSDSVSASASASSALDRSVQTVLNSPVGQAIENSLAKWSSSSPNNRNDLSLPTQSASQPQTAIESQSPSVSAPPLLSSTAMSSTAMSSTNAPTGNQSVQNQLTGYSPYEQYESFRVSVPTANQHPAIVQQPMTQQPVVQQPFAQFNFQQPTGRKPGGLFGNGAFTTQSAPTQSAPTQGVVANYGAHYATPQFAIPQYVSPHGYTNHTHTPTQLTANQWNIASAAQSPPLNSYVYPNGNNNSWIPTHATETSFRQVAPPPYGTQSMWK